MDRPKVSIALATYNGGRFLGEQLASFVRQTRLPDELVACDDGSSDDTVDILERFRAEAPFPVRVIRNQTNLGYVQNFERALSLCEGDILFLSDQDDVWFEDKIERILAEFEARSGALVVLNDQMMTDGNLVPSGTTKLDNIRRARLPELRFVTGCCSAHRRGWLAIALPIPAIGCSHDKWINELAHRLGVAHVLPVPLQFYRRHGENVSNSSISSLEPLHKVDHLAAKLARRKPPQAHSTGVPVPQWEQALLDRIAARHGQLAEMGLSAAADVMRAKIESRRAARERRQHIWTLPRLRRLKPVEHLWRSGGYDHFAGWKSAVRDLIQPRSRGAGNA